MEKVGINCVPLVPSLLGVSLFDFIEPVYYKGEGGRK